MPEPTADVAAAFAALGQGAEVPPNVYIVSLQSGNQITRASRLAPGPLLAALGALESERGPNAWFDRWVDGDGDRVGDVRSVLYVPPQAGAGK